MKIKLTSSLFGLLIGSLPVVSAQSEALLQRSLSASSFAIISSDAVLEVRAGRDLPLERELVDKVRVLLSARGFKVADKGQVIVTVDSTTPLPGITSHNAFTNADRLRSMDSRRNDRGVTMRFDDTNPKMGAAVFTIRMAAYEPGRPNLWVGQASIPDNGSGRRSTTLKLAEKLVKVFGYSEPRQR